MESEKLTLKPIDIESLLNCLALMSKVKGHGMAYELSFNLSKSRVAFMEWLGRFNEFRNSMFLKDEKGNPLKFVASKDGEILKPLEKDYKLQDGEFESYKVPEESLEEFRSASSEFNSEDMTLELKKISDSKIQEACYKGLFDGIDISILFDLNLVAF